MALFIVGFTFLLRKLFDLVFGTPNTVVDRAEAFLVVPVEIRSFYVENDNLIIIK